MSPSDLREVFQVAYNHALTRLRSGLAAEDLTTRPVVCLAQDMDLMQGAVLLAEKQFSGAPVVDGKGRSLG